MNRSYEKVKFSGFALKCRNKLGSPEILRNENLCSVTLILFFIFLCGNQRQGPEDRPTSTSFYLPKLKDFKGGLLKQNPWPLIFVHFCKKADLSLAYGSWQTETSRPTETLPSLVLTMYWANGFHLWGKQNLGSLKEKSYHSCSINGYISSNDIISTHNLSSRVTCSGCLPWHHLLPSS